MMLIVRPVHRLTTPSGLFSQEFSLIPSIFILFSIWARAIAIPPREPQVDHQEHQYHHHHHLEDDDHNSRQLMFATSADGGTFSSQYDASGSGLGSESNSGGHHKPHEQLEANHDYHSGHPEQTPYSNDNQPDILLSTNSLDHHQSYDAEVVAAVSDDDDSELAGLSKFSTEQSLPTSLQKPQNTYKEYLTNGLAEKACRLDRGCQRRDRLNNTYLNYCTRYKLENLFSSRILMSIMHDSPAECTRILNEFIEIDELIDQFYVLFKTLLTRYNCLNGYSVKWTCEDCKKAYKDWLCATSLPYYMNGEHIKPCISFCERVEQRCPYLHPITKEQYGGQPVFICRDPNIPFVPEITPNIPYSEPSKCYDLCHLSQNRTELFIDSLSKYDPNKCPDKNLVAEQVRNDIHCQVQQSTQSNETYNGGHGDEDDLIAANINGTADLAKHGPISVDIHMKKFRELKEVLTVYKNQPKTHKFGHHLEHS